MKITVIGTGYVGLVTGACFSETGIEVVCVDINKEKIDRLNKGEIPIYEPGIEPIVQKNIEKQRLSFTTDLKSNIEESEVIFIAVGTPPGEDGSADLSYVISVAEEIGKNIRDYLVVATKSTVPIGTSEKVRQAIKKEMEKRNEKVAFDVASNPEFLKEGAAVSDFLKPDRIIIGTDSEKAEHIMRKLYKPFLLNNHPIYFMDIPSAEMTKYAANSILATKISFMNDIANLCEKVGADINSVRIGIGSDKRIGNKFIYPGVGYGGSCFPKDVKALIRTAYDNEYRLEILEAVENVNNRQKASLFVKMQHYFGQDLKGKKIGIWGLSFKPNTDDMREAPSLIIIKNLLEAGATVSAYDPVAMDEARKVLGDKIDYASDQYDAVLEADALVLITEWPEFRLPNFRVMSKVMNNKVIFDGRNIYEYEDMIENGFDYFSIGRKGIENN